jgi:hypothetical protein
MLDKFSLLKDVQGLQIQDLEIFESASNSPKTEGWDAQKLGLLTLTDIMIGKSPYQ